MKSALVVIDVQKDYQAGGGLEIKGFNKAATNIANLLAWARSGNADIFHIQHISADKNDDSFAPDTPGSAFADGFSPLEGEFSFIKNKPSAFTAEGFATAIINGTYDQIILCGFSSFLCCDSTARDAYHRGYNVLFVDDAIGEFAFNGMTEEELHTYACAVMGLMFATVLKTRNIAPQALN